MTSLLAELRALVPSRPLGLSESLHLAEMQAQRLLAAQGVLDAPVPETIISEFPRVRLTRQADIPISGSSHWAHGAWSIVINADEPTVRQRFTMAHELKHVLDAPATPELLYPAISGLGAQKRTEQVCDFFAACLLMPRPWVKRAWIDGNQTTPVLARYFHVSQVAMRRRLVALGLFDGTARCDTDTSSRLPAVRAQAR